ncbi:hypothetical protein [Helicobacter pylori]|uniref:Uncharacterized protein n=1 Tax=Helicobacter pylori Aklavik86 TaxID=1055532 RepID=K7Y6M2_HELPX|nr:hypothetical protein [Helicobacter pylori]AFX89201.1 hypothetical protein HPAKL86_00875 [Helicobacter pylori Aklavik86]WQS14461.1 hypothetical protein KVD76_00885 [Helicobacter pylori]WQS24198.1 hypothetical protein KVD61_00890 [Helicobacter pylori]
MKALSKLSLYALLSFFIQTAHAESLKDTINYPDWLKINLFDNNNPLNQYVGSASISGKRNDFYAKYIPYDDKLPPEKNAEKVAFLRAKMNAYSALEVVLVTKKVRERIYEEFQNKDQSINNLFEVVDLLVSKSILAKRFVDTTNHRVYVMVQFPFVEPEDLIAHFKAKRINLSSTSAKKLSVILNKTLFNADT